MIICRLLCAGLFPAMLFMLPHQAGFAQTPVLDRQNAIDSVIAELEIAPPDFVRVWSPLVDYGFGPGMEGVLPTGTSVQPKFLNGQPYPGNTVTTSSPVYLFFVDDMPNALFAHPTRFVYVDAAMSDPTIANGGVVVHHQGWWPLITRPGQDQEELFGADGRASLETMGVDNPEGLVWGPSTSPPQTSSIMGNTPSRVKASANACALIFTGSPPGMPETAEAGIDGSADAMKAELMSQGVPAGRIHEARHGNKSDLKSLVEELCNSEPDCDKIYVYLGMHGLQNQLQMGSDGMVPEEEICELLAPLGEKGVPVCIIIEACHSGSLHDSLRPKFPEGVIISSSSADRISSTGTVPGVGDIGLYTYLFLRCWADPSADFDGNGEVNWGEAHTWVCTAENSKLTILIEGEEIEWDIKKYNQPVRSGLTFKQTHYQADDSGAWITETKRDADFDGKYDQCDWTQDDDCDGISDASYIEDDFDEDGNPEKKECFLDLNDDGTTDKRQVFEDTDDDGEWDSITKFDRQNGEWVETGRATRRSQDSFGVNPGTGSRNGGNHFVLDHHGEGWFSPDLDVVIGSQAKEVNLLGGFSIEGITSSYHPGLQDVVVIDFDEHSPSFGFDQAEDAFFIEQELEVDSIQPAMGTCGETTLGWVLGWEFDPEARVIIAGETIPSRWVDENTLQIEIPAIPCGQSFDVQVENPRVGEHEAVSTLEAAFHVNPAPDVQPPILSLPDDLTLMAGADGLSRLPASFLAEASDPEGVVTVTRNHAGALVVGIHQITFEAIDASGNRTLGSAQVKVQPEMQEKKVHSMKLRGKRKR